MQYSHTYMHQKNKYLIFKLKVITPKNVFTFFKNTGILIISNDRKDTMKQIITSLDIGTCSFKLIVGEIYNKRLNVLACSEVKSKGVKKGLIVNPEDAVESLKELFKKCEDIIDIKIKNVLICAPAYYAEFDLCEGYTTITRESGKINGDDIVRALQASVYNKVPSNKELISIMPVEYIINETETVSNPMGMNATRLSVKNVISLTPKKNIYGLVTLLESIGVSVTDICFNALADYHEYKLDEMNEAQGALINIGDEKTEVSIINKGVLTAVEVLDIGGISIDKDIMYAYNVNRKTAIYLKENFAFAHKKNTSTTELETVENKDGIKIKINQYEISEIVYSKLKEILELSKKQINLLTKKENSYIIVTGGTTDIDDASEVVEEVLGKSAILGDVSELGVRSNKYSSALGLIKYYHRKLAFRKKTASTMSAEDIEEIFNSKKKNTNNTILGKVFSYFFDN